MFDLILDLVVARRDYDNAVFCIDEPDTHMHAQLQAELLLALYDLILEHCQLMLATHSIGMMRKAQEIERKTPGSVAFLDFGGKDFDAPCMIEPIEPDRTFWKRAYEVAIGDLAQLVAPRRVVICEGHPKTESPVRNHSHDDQCYERIFETALPDTQFVSMGNHHEVMSDKCPSSENLRQMAA